MCCMLYRVYNDGGIDLTHNAITHNSNGTYNKIDIGSYLFFLSMMLLSYIAGCTNDKWINRLWAALFILIFIIPLVLVIPH